MKLLFDENLSFRLVEQLRDLFPESTHLESITPLGTPDEIVWRLAGEQGFILVSKDNDFRQLAFLRGAPPKVIWLRIGNAPSSKIAQTLRMHAERILAFDGEDRAALLVIDAPYA